MYTDDKILEILKQNKETGAKLLVEKYSPLIRSACAKKLQNKEDINECVNDVFAEFCMNIERYDETQSNLKNYLCTIAERRSVDRFRKNCRNEKMEHEVFKRYKEDEISKEHLAKSKEQLDDAMEQLPELDKQILEMHYYEGRSYVEIAQELEMNYETVRKRGLRGKKKLLYLILLGLLILGITACTTVVMKKHDLLPKWFPFYDWILPDETGNEEGKEPGIKDKIQSAVTEELKNNGLKATENDREEMAETIVTETEKLEGKTYQFSGKNGFIWSDEAVYEMVKNNQAYQKNTIHYEVAHAYYQDGELTVVFYIKWLEPEELGNYEYASDEWVEYVKNLKDQWDDIANKQIKSGYVLTENGEKLTLTQDSKTSAAEGAEALLCTYTAEWTPETKDADEIKLWIVLDENMIFDLLLSQLEVQEYEEQGDTWSLPDGSELKLGPAKTDDGTAVLILNQENVEEYKVSDLISNSYYAKVNKEILSPYLKDSSGNTYLRRRSSVTDVTTEETLSRQFQLYFFGVEAGEYTMVIPQLCMEKDAKTQTIRLEVPTKDDTPLACDVTTLFSDGTGLHITEINRTEEVEYVYNYDEESGELVLDTQNIWYYELEYELISVNELKLIGVRGSGVTSRGDTVECSIYDGNVRFRVNQIIGENDVETPEWLEVHFERPVYLLDEEISFPVTICDVNE